MPGPTPAPGPFEPVPFQGQGRTAVELPDWFAALNLGFHDRLTPVGAPAPDLHPAEPMTGNGFTIAGSGSGQRVCRQVAGVRADAWARGRPMDTEEEKAPEERGRYLHPDTHGRPPEQGTGLLRRRPPGAGPTDANTQER